MTAGQTQTGTFAGLLDGEDHLEMWLQVNTQYIGETYDNVVLSPQLEAGGTATAFEPYKSVLPITGRDSVEIAACGKNLFDINDRKGAQGQASVESDGNGWITISANNTNGASVIYGNYFTAASSVLRANTNYIIAYELVQADISGTVGIAIIGNNPEDPSQFANDWSVIINSSNMGTHLALRTTTSDFTDVNYMLRTFVYFNPGSSGTVKFRLSVLQYDPSMTAETFVYEPYRSMGGGTIAPTEPLYGLPGAEDTVEVSVDGDVTVTRRTAVLELDGTEDWTISENTSAGVHRFNMPNVTPAPKLTGNNALAQAYLCSHYAFLSADATWSGNRGVSFASTTANLQVCDMDYASVDAWKSYLAAQAAAGTPVTIVYELAVPEMEVLTAISPIVPQPGQLNLATDADALTATIHGSGWETVNDTSSIQDALANLDGDLASLINEVGLLNGEVGSIAQQIISPDGIKNIVFESSEYQAMANTVEVNANELSVTQATVLDINGRVETIEGTVRISGSNIDIGRSNSNAQLHLDNTGWSISEGGQETIYARQNRVVAPRLQTTSLIFGALAFNSSGGHFRLMKYGG